MDNFIIDKNKFPKSVHGQQCVGPCYSKNTTFIHPITLRPFTAIYEPECPTDKWMYKDETKYQDGCYLPSKGYDQLINTHIITPVIDFNCEHFIKYCYNINSFDEALDWIVNNENDPLYTQLRIIECSWKIYGKNRDILNNNIIEFYKNVIKKEWIYDIYNSINHYIYVDTTNNTIYLKKYDESSEKHNNKIEKINFILKKFIINDFIYKILSRHIDNNSDKWDLIESHNDVIKNETINYIINKINTTIE